MSVNLSPIFQESQFDDNGLLLSGGKLYWYAAGTTTPQDTFTDSSGVTPQANPIILNARGEPSSPIWLTSGAAYKAILKDADDNLIRSVDNISGINDVTPASVSEWANFSPQATYVSGTSFTIPGDYTSLLTPGRRLKCGSWYGTVKTISYGAPNSTVTVANDSGITFPPGTNSIQYSILSASALSIPWSYGSVGLIPGMMMMWPTPDCPAWALVRDGSKITRASYDNLFNALCPIRTGTTTLGSKSVTALSTTKDLYVGMPIESAGVFPAGTTVETITSATAITASQNALASGTLKDIRLFYYGYGNTGDSSTFGLPDDRGLFERGLDTGSKTYEKTVLSGTTTSTSKTITGLSSTVGLFVGMGVSGTGITGGSTVETIASATSITISIAATGSATVDLTFTGGQIGHELDGSVQSHTHTMGANGSIAATGATTVYVPGSGQATGTNSGAETRPRFRNYLPIIAY